MKTKRIKSLHLSALVIAMLPLSMTATAENKGTDAVTEARLETQIWTTYALSPHLRALDLHVAVNDGKATISGNADEDVKKELAQQIALGVKGISEVDNQIIVSSDYVAPKPGTSRRYSEVIDDAAITASIKSKLLWSKHADGLATEVDTQSGKVLLTGTAANKNAKEYAGTLAKNTAGVVSVKNNLQIKARTSDSNDKNTIENTSDAISDTWITTKVKSSLLYSSNVSGSSIKVITENGVVTLSGKVDGGAERALAIEIAQNVKSVKRVESKELTHDLNKVTLN